MNSLLTVFFDACPIGKLWLEPDRTYVFQYDPAWLEKPTAIALSVSLPLSREAYFGDVVRYFFANLLPEGDLRDIVARQLGISAQNVFGLLRELGGDCAGALSVYPEGISPDLVRGIYKPLNPEELAEIATSLPTWPFLVGSEGIRLTLAGAQDKLPVHCDAGTISLPCHGAPSTHILKNPISRFDSTVMNEAFCMKLAKNSGLPTPDCQIVQAGNTPLFLIDRYDRRHIGERILRLHQEDFCQAMGISPAVKYQSRGGPNIAECAELLRKHSVSPARDIKLLAKWCFANVLLGNADGHAKNLSLLYDQGKTPRLAPFYDLISTQAYESIDPKSSMKIGGENRTKWIMKRHWERLAQDLGLKPKNLLQGLSDFCQTMEEAITPTLESLGQQSNDAVFLERLVTDIKKRIVKTLQEIKR